MAIMALKDRGGNVLIVMRSFIQQPFVYVKDVIHLADTVGSANYECLC